MHIFAGSGAERGQVKVQQVSTVIRPKIHQFCYYAKGACKCQCVTCNGPVRSAARTHD